MMKVFLWRPTWAHFQLELFWQFAIGSSFLVTGFDSELSWVQRKVTLSPLARSIGCLWPNSDSLSFPSSNYIQIPRDIKRNLDFNFVPLWAGLEELPSSVQILVRWAIDCGENQRVRSTLRSPEAEKDRRTKALFPWRKSAELNQKNYSEIPSWFHFHFWTLNCSKTGNSYREFCE
jgi:hypothetical protein